MFSVVFLLRRNQQNPPGTHWQSLKRVARYMRGTKTKHLKCIRDDSKELLVGLADADWASDLEDKKSVNGYQFIVFGKAVKEKAFDSVGYLIKPRGVCVIEFRCFGSHLVSRNNGRSPAEATIGSSLNLRGQSRPNRHDKKF